jgi:hypothetical protein
LIFEYRDEGLTPEIPSNCPQKLVELMQMCWKKELQQRPVSSLLFLLFITASYINVVHFKLWFYENHIQKNLFDRKHLRQVK